LLHNGSQGVQQIARRAHQLVQPGHNLGIAWSRSAGSRTSRLRRAFS
jgi:hypothetical protein